jgi:hypothetical protein
MTGCGTGNLVSQNLLPGEVSTMQGSNLARDNERFETLEVIQNEDGRIEVFALSPDNRVWHTWQISPNNGWEGD